MTLLLLTQCSENDPTVLKIGSISSSETWIDIQSDPSFVDYIVRGPFSIDNGATLTIEEGVVIFFEQDAALHVNDGSLVVNGSEANLVVLLGSTFEAGHWHGIFINEGASASFKHASIAYGGGAAIFPDRPAANIQCKGELSLKNTIIHNSEANGLTLWDEAKLLEFDNNQFVLNKENAFFLEIELSHYMSNNANLVSSNGFNGAYIDGTLLQDQGNITWSNLSEFGGLGGYKLSSLELSNTQLTLASGVSLIIEQEGGEIVVGNNSSLNVIGDKDAIINIEGSMNNKGFWKGILVMGETVFSFCNIKNTGYASVEGDLPAAAIEVFEGKMNISNTVITNGAGCGITLKGTNNVVNSDMARANTFIDLDGEDICE